MNSLFANRVAPCGASAPEARMTTQLEVALRSGILDVALAVFVTAQRGAVPFNEWNLTVSSLASSCNI